MAKKSIFRLIFILINQIAIIQCEKKQENSSLNREWKTRDSKSQWSVISEKKLAKIKRISTHTPLFVRQ